MEWRKRRSIRILLSILTILGVLLLPPAPVLAETSYHKLKKRLRKAEKATGYALKVAGAVTAVVVIKCLLDSLESDTDHSPTFCAELITKPSPKTPIKVEASPHPAAIPVLHSPPHPATHPTPLTTAPPSSQYPAPLRKK